MAQLMLLRYDMEIKLPLNDEKTVFTSVDARREVQKGGIVKRTFKTLAVLAATMMLSSAMAATSVKMLVSPKGATPKSKEVVVGIIDSFIPGNFDRSSDVYVVVNGMFNNGCYAWNRADVTLNVEPMIHEVKAVANVREGMCPMVLLPFTREVRMGVLGAGDHTIRFMNGDGTYSEKSLSLQ